MTPTPPYFITQMEDQKKWDDGFKAGITEVLTALSEGASESTIDDSTKTWISDFSQKFSNKYL